MLKKPQDVCMTNDDNERLHIPYKMTKAVHDLMNMKMGDDSPHVFKEKVKLEFKSVKSVHEKFLCRTADLNAVLE